MPSFLDWLTVIVVLLIGGLLVMAVLGNLLLWHDRSLQKRLFKAALRDVDRLRVERLLQKGVPIDVRDRDGYTALHLSYYYSRPTSVELLLTLGADGDVLNHELRPDEMTTLKRHVDALEAGHRLLDREGNWIDPEVARVAYDELRAIDERFVGPAMTRLLLKRGTSRRQVMRLAMKLGRPRSKEQMVELFLRFGDPDTAEEFLNSGSRIFSDAARKWADDHNHYVLGRQGSGKFSWGRF
jgi:hypothetical protein